MERIIAPCFLVNIYSHHLTKTCTAPIIVPEGTLPADLYNALLTKEFVYVVSSHYSWITSKRRILTQEEAAVVALETNQLDKKVKKYLLEHFDPLWNKGKTNARK